MGSTGCGGHGSKDTYRVEINLGKVVRGRGDLVAGDAVRQLGVGIGQRGGGGGASGDRSPGVGRRGDRALSGVVVASQGKGKGTRGERARRLNECLARTKGRLCLS